MSEIFRMPIIAACYLTHPFFVYFERVGHWHPLVAMGLPIGAFFALKALLPAWLVLSIVYTLNAALIVLISAMCWTCLVHSRRDRDPSRE